MRMKQNINKCLTCHKPMKVKYLENDAGAINNNLKDASFTCYS